MNKTELIAAVAEKCAMKKKDAECAVTATFDTVTSQFADKSVPSVVVAVIFAVPCFKAETLPVASTVATSGAEEVHVAV